MKATLASGIFIGAYVLIATEWVHRLVVALGGAGLMFLFQITDAERAFDPSESGVDWSVIFLLFGMMIIVAALRQTGVFEYLAVWSAKRARGSPLRILLTLMLITAVASALLDNVTTILLVAPVTVLIAERLGVPPVPFLIAEVMSSNVGGAATLVGDPPNILIGSASGLTYLDFLLHLGPIVVILLGVLALMSGRLFRASLHRDPDRLAEVMALDEREALVGGTLLPKSGAVLGVVTLAFVLQGPLGYEPAVVALLGAGVLALTIGDDERAALVREVEWPTLAFFLGLFVMVGALVHTGVIEELARLAVRATDGSLLLATILLVVVSAVLSAVVDNVPYVATMTPLVLTLSRSIPGDTTVLWWALALGADLGGNATSIGASANVVALGVADRSGHPIRFVEFFKTGGVVTAVTVTLALAYLLVRYFVLAS